MPFATLNGTRLHYRVDGVGERAFLLFNGLGATIRTWSELAEGMARLGRVIRFDLRGAGETGMPSEPFTLETLAADGLALIDLLGIDKPIVVGHAFGGRVAQVFARDHPGRTAALIICGTGGQFPPLPSRARHDATDRSLDRTAWEAAWLADFCAAEFRERQPVRAQNLLAEMWEERQRPSQARLQRAAAAATPSPSYWGMARAPALLLYGSEDRQGSEENARDLAARLPGARLVFIEQAAHMAIREQPERLLVEISKFVEEQGL